MLSHTPEVLVTVNTSLHAVCGIPQTGEAARLQGYGLDSAMASVIPCAWTKFPRPGLSIVSIITLFYIIVGFSAIILNGLVVILYFR